MGWECDPRKLVVKLDETLTRPDGGAAWIGHLREETLDGCGATLLLIRVAGNCPTKGCATLCSLVI